MLKRESLKFGYWSSSHLVSGRLVTGWAFVLEMFHGCLGACFYAGEILTMKSMKFMKKVKSICFMCFMPFMVVLLLSLVLLGWWLWFSWGVFM